MESLNGTFLDKLNSRWDVMHLINVFKLEVSFVLTKRYCKNESNILNVSKSGTLAVSIHGNLSDTQKFYSQILKMASELVT